MDTPDLAHQFRRDRMRAVLVVAAVIAVTVACSLYFLEPAPPRRIVLASGPEFGLYHVFAQRYREVLARQGITVQERMTDGADANLRLLLDPASGVDVAFVQGGLATSPATDALVMLASLYYEPLWVLCRSTESAQRVNQLRGKRLAIGVAGSGTRALVSQLLVANGLMTADGAGASDAVIVPLGGDQALTALQAGRVDAAFFVGGAQTPLIQRALHDTSLRLMSIVRADGYARRFSFLSKLTLPAGTIDLAKDVPPEPVDLVGTKAMLVARDGFHPALINLLVDAAREIHGGQGYFERPGEFPGTAAVDLRVSPYADEHRRFGSRFLYAYLPFWVATIVERALIVLVPLLVIVVPLVNFLPQVLNWRVRSRIYRWYGELSLMGHAVENRTGRLPVEQWLRDLERIERAVAHARTPAKFASEAYTLREHIDLVRRKLLEKAALAASRTDDPGDRADARQRAT